MHWKDEQAKEWIVALDGGGAASWLVEDEFLQKQLLNSDNAS